MDWRCRGGRNVSRSIGYRRGITMETMVSKDAPNYIVRRKAKRMNLGIPTSCCTCKYERNFLEEGESELV